METDIVIVGAGTAGCALARRLVEKTAARVVLVEAGPRYPGWALDAPLAGLRLRRAWSWRHFTIPQAGLENRRIPLPMGRVAGGSSSVNAMVAAPGTASIFDDWSNSGCPGWSADEIFASLQNVSSTLSAPVLPVCPPRFESSFSTAFLQACEQSGLQRVGNFIGDQSQTCGMFPLFQKGGKRCSSNALLSELEGHPRFKLLTGHTVRRVLICRQRAEGVEIQAGSRITKLRAAAGVILSAGALQSPVLLQLSGVGRAALLRSAGIDIQLDLPQVGEGLQDHVGAPLLVHSGVPSPGRLSRWIPAAAEWLWARSGVMTSNCCEAGCFLGPSSTPPVGEIFTHFQTARHPHAVELMCALLQPASRGSVRINPNDPWGPPLIDPGYLSDKADVVALGQILEAARHIVAQPALRAFGLGVELMPGRQSPDEFLRKHATTCHHPVGSCRMGIGSDAVLDPGLNVKGIAQLWVVDNSVVPGVPRGHTASTALIIAEHGSRLILPQLGGTEAELLQPPPESRDCQKMQNYSE
jgi:choline dehydrogenase